MTGERDLASHFDVVGGRVVRFARYDGLDQALEATNLGPTNEVSHMSN